MKPRATSWIIRERATGRVLCEVFNRCTLDKLNCERYEAVPIYDYLTGLNRAIQQEANHVNGM